MLRKTIVTTLALLSSTYANAAFYLGVGGGPQMVDFSHDSHIFQPGGFDTRNKTSLAAKGFFASLFAGYGRYFLGPDLRTENIYLAGEINVNGSNAEHFDSNSEFVHKEFSNSRYKINRSFGLSVIPGFLVTETTLFYGRLGFSKGHFKLTTNDVSLTSTNKSLDGIWYGLGVRQGLSQHISAFIEYSQTNYQGLKIRTLSTNNTTKVVNITPVIAQVEFGAIYNFS